jgi:hypothetical protein
MAARRRKVKVDSKSRNADKVFTSLAPRSTAFLKKMEKGRDVRALEIIPDRSNTSRTAIDFLTQNPGCGSPFTKDEYSISGRYQ